MHAFTQLLIYWWHAKGRHGTHSPFVYSMVEEVLLKQSNHNERPQIKVAGLDGHYNELLSRIAHFYNYTTVLDAGGQVELNPASKKFDMIVLQQGNQQEWQGQLKSKIEQVNNTGVIVVPAIHKTKGATADWNSLCSETVVRMSIDLYGLGLLFFRSEFRVKQHFVLKHK